MLINLIFLRGGAIVVLGEVAGNHWSSVLFTNSHIFKSCTTWTAASTDLNSWATILK